MTILIGYVPTPEGAAVSPGDGVVIVSSPRRGATVDADLAVKPTA